MFDTENIIKIPINEIKVEVALKNIRTWMDDEKVKELANSIYEDGLMSPIVIMDSYDEANNEIIELVAGARRLKAIKYIRNSKDSTFMDDGVPCIQFEGSLQQAIFASAQENIAREDVDDVDLAQWIADRIDEGITQTEIAERIHKSLQYVSFRYQFHTRATDELKQFLRDGGITFTPAYELSKNQGPAEQNKMIEEARKFNKKISLGQARTAGKVNQSIKPSKKARDKMLARATVCSEDKGSEIAAGIVFALSWVEGLIDNEEMNHAIEQEEK